MVRRLHDGKTTARRVSASRDRRPLLKEKGYNMKVRSRLVSLVGVAATIVCLVGVALAANTDEAGSTAPAAASTQTAVRLSPHSGPMPIAGPALARALGLGQAPAGPRPKLAEEEFKNITVLRGSSVDDFMGTMGLMAAALGYCCSNCHNNAGTDFVKWDADDNTYKRTARKMVTMVQAINKANFNGRQVVTCWTCNRGRDVPVMTPSLDAVYSEAKVELDDVLTRAPGVPPADQIIDKYLQAIGGAQKVAGITSYAAKGKSTGFGGFGGGGEVEMYAVAPNKRAVYIRFPEDPQRGDNTRTFDGKTGWVATPLSVLPTMELTGGELDGARMDAQLMFPSQIKTALTNLRVGPPDQIGGQDYDVVQGNGARGTIGTLYFNRKTGLLGRYVRMIPSAIGKVPIQVDYEDYRDVNGIKLPYHVTFSWLDGRDSLELTDLRLNVPVDAAKFGKPNPAPTKK